MSADPSPNQSIPSGGPTLDTVRYDNRIVMAFLIATMIWGVVGFLVGVIVAAQLAFPALNFDLPWISFGRLRPLHTNAVIFAFAGNGIFAGVYYSLQRLCKTRLFNDTLSWVHFWGWQLIIVSAALTLPLGITTSKEYAELEWPIKIAIAVVWLIFATNVMGSIAVRRERHLYVAIWFYVATLIAITMLHVVNSLGIPYSLWHSYPVYAGLQDALVQWWYGHNAVAFFLTTPFLGLMYYFLPKAAEQSVYSYRLSILHFWSLLFIYIWAGPHHLLNSSMPEWAQTLGVVFSVMLIAPSWGGAINGYLTLRGRWDRVRTDPVLQFYVASITAYTMTTLEGSLLSLREVNALSHNTDWTIGHVHNGALGWVGFLVLGMTYWLIPRITRTPMWSKTLVNVHFWLAAAGVFIYVVAMWVGGILQGVMQLWFDDQGHLVHPDFMNVVRASIPWYHLRLLGGLLYLVGMVIGLYNVFKTITAGRTEDDVVQVPPMQSDEAFIASVSAPGAKPLGTTAALHGLIERWPLALVILSAIALSIGSVLEIVPSMIQGSLTPKVASVQPYTPLELAGRDIYIREGCNNCHTQMVRTLRAETERYGTYTQPGEHIYDRPHLWGSKRTGPDLAREGVIRPSAIWHYRHLVRPRSMIDGSIMPNYPWLAADDLDTSTLNSRVQVLAAAPLYTPYGKDVLADAPAVAQAQAALVAAELAKDPDLAKVPDLAKKEITAVIAYLQRLGTDLGKNTAAVERK